jgi:drug/metabolite transporter superfamily protein YnfA
MLFGALLLPLYGFAVNLFWRGDFSRLLGAYAVIFFAVSQLWGRARRA